MTRRREVRVSESFFAELDDQLGAERGPHGQPSATDFIVVDLPAIVEQFAAAFDDLPDSRDVDILVAFEQDRTPGLIGLSTIELELESLLGRRVDLRTYGDLSRYSRHDVRSSSREIYAA